MRWEHEYRLLLVLAWLASRGVSQNSPSAYNTSSDTTSTSTSAVALPTGSETTTTGAPEASSSLSSAGVAETSASSQTSSSDATANSSVLLAPANQTYSTTTPSYYASTTQATSAADAPTTLTSTDAPSSSADALINLPSADASTSSDTSATPAADMSTGSTSAGSPESSSMTHTSPSSTAAGSSDGSPSVVTDTSTSTTAGTNGSADITTTSSSAAASTTTPTATDVDTSAAGTNTSTTSSTTTPTATGVNTSAAGTNTSATSSTTTPTATDVDTSAAGTNTSTTSSTTTPTATDANTSTGTFTSSTTTAFNTTVSSSNSVSNQTTSSTTAAAMTTTSRPNTSTTAPLNTTKTTTMYTTSTTLSTQTTSVSSQHDVQESAKALNASSPTAVSDFSKVIDSIASGAKNSTSQPLDPYVSALNITVQKMSEAAWTSTDLKNNSEKILQAAATLMTSLAETNTQAASHSRASVGQLFSSVESSILDLGALLTRNKMSESLETDLLKVSFQRNKGDNLVDKKTVSGAVSLTLPDSLTEVFGQQALLVTVMACSSFMYKHAVSPPNVNPSGSVAIVRLTDRYKNEVSADRLGGKATVAIVHPTFQATSADGTTERANDSIICSDAPSYAVLSLQFTVPAARRLVLVGNFGGCPTEYIYDFQASVTSSDIDVTHAHDNVALFVQEGVAKVYIQKVSTTVRTVCFRATYSELPSASARRRLLASDATAMEVKAAVQVSAVSVVTWDSTSLAWTDNSSVLVSGITTDGHVEFKSSFLGTFSLSELVIAPTEIDFSAIFLNFNLYLQNSPYVLSVICCILLSTVIVTVWLRRLDLGDAALWTYLPLVDNRVGDMFVYTVSVHTSLRSPRHFTATPFFVLMGQHASTNIRVLMDGVRENFGSGTVSNFTMTSPVNLGQMLALNIWHDDKGKHPHWKLDRVVVVDRSNNEVALFVCCEWLSASKSDGRISRHLSAFLSDCDSGSDVFDIVSARHLWDDHLWLSVLKRPTYSTFTRVQRFLCAIALLFLAMLSDAMFFRGKEASYEKIRGVTIGSLQINYRQLYTGLVSALMLIPPAIIMSWSFKHRRVRGTNSSSQVLLLQDSESRSGEASPFKQTSECSECLDTVQSRSTAKKEDCKAGRMGGRCYPKFYSSEHVPCVLSAERLGLLSSTWSPTDSKKENGKKLIVNSDRRVQLHPWWFIFVGYFVIVLSIATGAFFCFMYSLEWGRWKSCDWLLALLFSTSTEAVVVQPVKIVLISFILSSILRHHARDDIAEVAPYSPPQNDVCAVHPDSSCVPAPHCDPAECEDLEELESHWKNQKHQQRMCGIIYSLGLHVLYLVVLYILCHHVDINTSFMQNNIIQEQMPLQELKMVNSSSKTWDWIQRKFIPQIMSSYKCPDCAETQSKNLLLADGCNLRFGPVIMKQYRVKDTCYLPPSKRKLFGIERCKPPYSDSVKESGSFSPEWRACTANCTDSAYMYDSSGLTSMAYNGQFGLYGPGGYCVSLGLTKHAVRKQALRLQKENWLDQNTRAVTIEVNFFNANTQLFTQARILLEFPAVGGCLWNITVRSANLYPYVSVWDYFVLLLQILFVVIIVVRVCLMFKAICCPSKKHRCSKSVIVTGFELVISLAAIIFYILRIDRTLYIVERIRNYPETYTSFDAAFYLDDVWRICLSVCCFLHTLRFLGPLSFVYHLHLFRRTLLNSLSQQYGLSLVLTVVTVAFASLLYLSSGANNFRLRSFDRSYLTLHTVFLTMTKYIDIAPEGADTVQLVLHHISFSLYCFVAAIFMMNMAISILNSILDETKKSAYMKNPSSYDGDFSEFLWGKLRKLFFSCAGSGAEELANASRESCVRLSHTPVLSRDWDCLEAKVEKLAEILLNRALAASSNEFLDTQQEYFMEKVNAETKNGAAVDQASENSRSGGNQLLVDVLHLPGTTLIRIMDSQNRLLYLLAIPNPSVDSRVECHASDISHGLSRQTLTGKGVLAPRVIHFSYSGPMTQGEIEVGIPVSSCAVPETCRLAVKFTPSEPWIYLPTVEHSREGFQWTRLQGVPRYLATIRFPVLKHSKGSIVHQCRLCKFATFDLTLFQDHQAVHSMAGIYFCLHRGCMAQFMERYRLIRHLQEKHGYPQVCPWCGRGFQSAHALKEHSRSHSITRPFKCRACGSKFLTRHQRDGHRFIAHSGWNPRKQFEILK